LDEDYKKFCLKCVFLDEDYGCTCPPYEEVYQCDMYRHYHPQEVAEFEKYCDEYCRSNKESDKE